MLLVIELDEDRLVSLLEALHPLLEDALQHVLENDLPVDDLDNIVEIINREVVLENVLKSILEQGMKRFQKADKAVFVKFDHEQHGSEVKIGRASCRERVQLKQAENPILEE